jgi:hypothetical protein
MAFTRLPALRHPVRDALGNSFAVVTVFSSWFLRNVGKRETTPAHGLHASRNSWVFPLALDGRCEECMRKQDCCG